MPIWLHPARVPDHLQRNTLKQYNAGTRSHDARPDFQLRGFARTRMLSSGDALPAFDLNTNPERIRTGRSSSLGIYPVPLTLRFASWPGEFGNSPGLGRH